MPVTESIDRIVADIHRDRGSSTAWIADVAAERADAENVRDEAEELAGAVDAFVRDAPAVSTMRPSIKHGPDCHTRHVQCLAARIRKAIEEQGYSCVD